MDIKIEITDIIFMIIYFDTEQNYYNQIDI